MAESKKAVKERDAKNNALVEQALLRKAKPMSCIVKFLTRDTTRIFSKEKEEEKLRSLEGSMAKRR